MSRSLLCHKIEIFFRTYAWVPQNTSHLWINFEEIARSLVAEILTIFLRSVKLIKVFRKYFDEFHDNCTNFKKFVQDW